MYSTLSKWILFFFIYGFVGWIWESSYASLSKKEMVSRGFLQSPIVPVYGFGAIIILCITEPFKNNVFLIFLLGMIGATILEYFTGLVSEKLFDTKLWDYSRYRFNINGHICLLTSLSWGLFSILLVKYVHQPIKEAVFKLPYYVVTILSILFLLIYIVDTTMSIQTALNTKSILVKKNK